MSDTVDSAPFKHAFIVTYGRTGSTLLQGVLNACPGVTIHGENSGFFYYLYKAYESALLAREHVAGLEASAPSHAFYGADGVDIPRLKAAIAGLMRDHLHRNDDPAGSGLRGFKEVRYDMPDLEAYLDFLGEVFERSCFIFLTRDARETGASGFWKGGDPALVEGKLRYMERAFEGYRQRHPGRCFALDYADLSPTGPVLLGLLENLGLAADPEGLRGVFNEPHSYDPRSVVFHDNARIVRRPGVDAMLALLHFEKARPDLSARVAFTGIALPHPASPALDRIYAVSHTDPGEAHEARAGLATPGYASRHPDNPHAGRCRFSVDFAPRDAVYALHAVLGDRDVVIADIHVATPVARVFSD